MRACVISFPKSGRTWLRFMLSEFGVKPEYTHAGAGHGSGNHMSLLDTSAIDDYDRLLLLVRDPRDAVLSGFHTAKNRFDVPYEGGLGEFLRDPRHGIEKAVNYNLMWAEAAAERDYTALVTYEQLRSDTVPTLSSVLRFFDYQTWSWRVWMAVRRNSIANMRRRELEKRRKRNDTTEMTENTFKARRGQIGSHRDEMSADDVAYCNDVMDKAAYRRRIDASLAKIGLVGHGRTETLRAPRHSAPARPA